MIFKHTHPHRPTKCWCECPPSFLAMQLEPQAIHKRNCALQKQNIFLQKRTSESKRVYIKLHTCYIQHFSWQGFPVIPGCLAKRLNFKPILEIHQICKQVAESTGSRLQLSNPMSQTSFQPCFGWRVLPHSFNQFHPCSRQVPNIFRIHGSMTLNGGQFQRPNFRQVTGSKWESIAANCWKTSPLCVQFLENLWALDPLRCGQCVWSLLGAL